MADVDSVREEFLSEAQEIVESLSRDLLFLDHGQKEGKVDPDLVHEVFRGVHTLKGLAGMFGFAQLGALAHAMENLLDDLRLGRVNLSQDVLDVLFEGVENFQRILADAKAPDAKLPEVDLAGYAEALERVAAPAPRVKPGLDEFEIDPNVLGVLTEYEEHRLRTNVEQGNALFRLKVKFSLQAIDGSLEELKQRAKPLGEIITYLPSMGAGDGDDIELDVLLASKVSLAELTTVLEVGGAQISAVPRRGGRLPTSRPPGLPLPPLAPEELVSRPPRTGSSHGPIGTIPPPAGPGSSPPARVPVNAPSAGGDVVAAKNDDALSMRSVSNTVRVDIAKLDHLMNVVGELAIVRSTVARLTDRVRQRAELRALATELHRIHRGFERHLQELQDGILGVRMVQLGQIFDKLARLVRQVARDHAKEIRLVVTGAETEVDKLIVEELSDPLMHLIRNAIDHGIEPAKQRELNGKPKAGTLALNAYQKGSHVLIEIEDDGNGMDMARILATAVKRGLLTEEEAQETTEQEAYGLIFTPGFSTREDVTDLSGRGVGLDVVKTNISRLGGVVDVQSSAGIGTKFTITLPITLAIVSALIVRIGAQTFALPLSAVQEALMLDARSLRTVEGREVITLRGGTLPICRLASLFGIATEEGGRRFVVVCSVGQRRLGLVVDELHGQQDVVIKALGPSLRAVRGFSGATDLGDQRVALVLDAGAILEEQFQHAGERALTGAAS